LPSSTGRLPIRIGVTFALMERHLGRRFLPPPEYSRTLASTLPAPKRSGDPHTPAHRTMDTGLLPTEHTKVWQARLSEIG